MAIDANAKNNEFQTKVLSSINETSDNAYQKMIAKKAEYEAAKEQESIYNQLRGKAQSKYESLLYKHRQGKRTSGLQEAKSHYNSVMSTYGNASNNTDILRMSYQSDLSYYGKMSQSASLANSILA